MPTRSLAALVLALAPALFAHSTAASLDTAPAVQGMTVSLPQRFVEGDDGFLLMGRGVLASLETGRLRWMITGPESGTGAASVITAEPVGARPGAEPRGERLLPGVVSRFRGPPSEWRAGRRTYGAVRYAELWHGIDLLLEAEGQTLKGTYVVAPGADPRAVRWRQLGADAVSIDGDGRLVLQTPSGELVDAAPVAWQEIDGERHAVSVAFVVEPVTERSTVSVTVTPDDSVSDGVTHSSTDGSAPAAVDVSFRVGPHDLRVPLLIDPAVIVQAGFLGGAAADQVVGIAVDAAGALYITGNTTSSEASFPVAVGPDLTWNGPGVGTQGDVFVAKLDPTGNTLLYAGFLGGASYEYASGIAVDSLGRAYISGRTNSTENQGFPAVVGPSVTHSGNQDAFVARVAADGSALEYCGFIGGNAEDRGLGINVDELFRAYVVGRFQSLPATLPLVVGPSLATPSDAYNGFAARVSPSGASLEYCGYVAGNNWEDITGVVPDPFGGAWITGWTLSDDLPVSVGPDLTYNGGTDVLVAHIAFDGSAFTSFGYLGGALSDFPNPPVLDAGGSLYVSGLTQDAFSFPALVGPNLVPGGVVDGFITKIAANGTSILWSGFTGTESGAQVEVDADGGCWFLTGLFDGPLGGADGQIGRILPSGAGFDFRHAFGGPAFDVFSFFGLVPPALTPGVTEVWCAGTTTLDETQFPVVSGPDVTANGGTDVGIVRLQIAPDPWLGLGFAKAGTHGDPLLHGEGTLGPLSPFSVSLDNALENTIAWLALGFATVNAPFKGGTFVPDITLPGVLLPQSTGAAGTTTIGGTWPAGLPAGFTFYLQSWVQDPGASFNAAASNAVSGTTP